jgi:tRNA-Thr(GGU) m(6)t(6)A37 methyltransferase TsaA
MRREGETTFATDPAAANPDAGVVFVGRVRSPWTERADCPKNMAAARERGVGARIEIAETFRPALAGLDGFSHVVLLTWLHGAQRDLATQAPRHLTAPRGTFALRSPARPNPIGLHVARLVSLDVAGGVAEIDAIDVLDGTPLVDLKPYYASIDAFPEATRPSDGTGA